MFCQKLRHVIIVLTMLVCCDVAFSDEIEDAANAGDFVRLRALLKTGHKFDEFLDAVRADDWKKQKDLFDEDPKLAYAHVFVGHGEIQDEAAAGNLEKVRALLVKDPTLASSTNNDGLLTPLHCAVKNGHLDVMKLLLDYKADVNASSTIDGTPLDILFFGPDGKDPEKAALLLSHGANVNATNSYGLTPLHLAVDGDVKMAGLLLAHGADVNARDQFGQTPLARAASTGTLAMVKLLLAHGSDINALDKDGETPLDNAEEHHNGGIAIYLRLHGGHTATLKTNDFAAIKEAILVGDQPRVKTLLKANPKLISSKDDDEMTPLHMAVDAGNKDMVNLLLANSANVNVHGMNDITPLELAAVKGDTKMAALLLARGAEIESKDKNSQTALGYAVQSDSKEMTKFLLDHKADVNVRSKYGQTLMHTAAAFNLQDIAEVLLAHGADINVKDKEGLTPLHLVTDNGDTNMVEWLRERGGHN